MENTERSTEPLNPRTYTIDQAAQLLGIGRNQCYEAAKRGDIPCIRLGRRMVIPRAAFDRLLDGKAA